MGEYWIKNVNIVRIYLFCFNINEKVNISTGTYFSAWNIVWSSLIQSDTVWYSCIQLYIVLYSSIQLYIVLYSCIELYTVLNSAWITVSDNLVCVNTRGDIGPILGPRLYGPSCLLCIIISLDKLDRLLSLSTTKHLCNSIYHRALNIKQQRTSCPADLFPLYFSPI